MRPESRYKFREGKQEGCTVFLFCCTDGIVLIKNSLSEIKQTAIIEISKVGQVTGERYCSCEGSLKNITCMNRRQID